MQKQEVIGIYLAAGNSKRFGQNKLKYLINGKPLGSIALTTALQSKLDRVIVVTANGIFPDWIPAELFHTYRNKLHFVSCPGSKKGQSHSIICGLTYAKTFHPEAIMILLADQPFITAAMIAALIDKYMMNKENHQAYSFVASSHHCIPKPPILFSKSMLPKLDKLSGDKGARFFIREHFGDGELLEFANPLFFLDIDAKTDLHKLGHYNSGR